MCFASYLYLCRIVPGELGSTSPFGSPRHFSSCYHYVDIKFLPSLFLTLALNWCHGKSSESVKSTCWRPVTHAQTLASYSAVYQFGSLSDVIAKFFFTFKQTCQLTRLKLVTPTWSGSDPLSNTKPVWPTCRLKTSMGADLFRVDTFCSGVFFGGQNSENYWPLADREGLTALP